MRRSALLAGLALACTAPASASPATETFHVVEEGETLYGIANRAGVPASRIAEANGLEEPYVIRIGQKLQIPRQGKPASRAAAARTASSSASSGSGAVYVVKPGDTLLAIALAEKVPQVLMAEANGLKPPYTIRAGQKLLVPRTRRHTVAEGDTGFGLAYRYAVPWENIAVANGIEPDAPLRIGQELLIPTVLDTRQSAPASPVASSSSPRFAWPLSGPIRRGFRSRNSSDYHDGLDIDADEGAAVRAAAAGTVIFAGEEKKQFGNLVVIDHGGGWHSAYGSLSGVTVKRGEKVGQGERIGFAGNTSVTKRTELHFELRRDGRPVDPLSELPKVE
jgi:murein DD-endopeptidase MepM/ murein hydrolase activator NlpD